MSDAYHYFLILNCKPHIMKSKISCLILLLAQCAFAQMKPDHSTTVQNRPAGATVKVKENPIDSTIVKAVALPKHNTGNPENVFTDDTGCSRQYAASQSEFSKMLQIINVGTTDDVRLLEAFRLARKSCLSAAQITQICKSLTLEKTRLEFAKFAFSTCVDPKNYGKVCSVFQKKAHISDLTMYITGR